MHRLNGAKTPVKIGRSMRVNTYSLVFGLVLTACGPQGTRAPERSDLSHVAIKTASGAAPSAKPGECWASDTIPAVIETVTEQKIVTPQVRGANGTVTEPAIYRTTVSQNMVQERSEVWFRAPCPEVQDVEFVTTLQRALKARGYFSTPLTGVMDDATTEAVRRFQAAHGLDSPVLSLAAAQELGLISVDLADL